MITAVLFVVAAGAGAIARSVLATSMWRTAAVNIAGSFGLGLLSTWTGPEATIVGVGALGSLTTFSTFAAQAVDSERLQGAVYLVVSLVGGIAAAALALSL